MEGVETFPALDAVPGVEHAFTTRAFSGGAERHAQAPGLARRLGLRATTFRFGNQVHGNHVAAVDSASPEISPATDALCTGETGVAVGVSVADCGPVLVADRRGRAVGAAHSGRKGTELGVLPRLLETMAARFGCAPADLVVQLGPCIRPPFYEVDFAAEIRRQAAEAGVLAIHDCGACTGREVDRYFSYRIEKGVTGRMVAVIALW